VTHTQSRRLREERDRSGSEKQDYSIVYFLFVCTFLTICVMLSHAGSRPVWSSFHPIHDGGFYNNNN